MTEYLFARYNEVIDVSIPVTANFVMAGPTTGAAAPPTFRSLVDQDIPDTLTLTGITGPTTLTGALTVTTDLTVNGDITVLSGLRVGFAGAPADDIIELGDANLSLSFGGGTVPVLTFDSTDSFRYTRSTNTFEWVIAGAVELALDANALRPGTDASVALGTTTQAFNGLHLNTGTAINWENGDITVTGNANSLVFAGASSGYSFDASLLLASGTALNWASGDITVTHSANLLTFAGASSGYSFDAALLLPGTGTAINFGAGDVTIIPGANALSFTGALNGYSFDALVTVSTTAAGATNLLLTNNDAGAAAAPFLILERASGSPAASDVLGMIQWNGRDSGAAAQSYAGITSVIGSPTAGTEEGQLRFYVTKAGTLTDLITMSSGTWAPTTNDTMALGTTTLMWSDAFLASGAVINFNNGDVTITHSADLLAFAGAASGYTFSHALLPSANDGAALGSTANQWSDLFLANGGVINFNNGNYTITNNASQRLQFGSSASTFGIHLDTANPTLDFDANDFIFYDRTNNAWNFVIGSVAQVIVFNQGIQVPTHGTTATAANAVINTGASNSLQRSTSSGTFKRDIRDVDGNLIITKKPTAPTVDKMLRLQAVRYKSAIPTDDQTRDFYGLIAEDVAAVDPDLVDWGYFDEDYEAAPDALGIRHVKANAVKKPIYVHYDRLSVLLLDRLQRQEARLTALEARG